MRNFRVNFMLVVVIFYFSQSAVFLKAGHAATVKFDIDGNVSHIQGINISGDLYNIEFRLGGLDLTFSGPAERAMNAAAEINSVINELSPKPGAVSDGIVSKTEFYVFSNIVVLSPGPGLPALGFELYGGAYAGEQDFWQPVFRTNPTTTFLMMAHFSPVPLPAAVWLFGIGFIGIIAVAGKKQMITVP